MKNCLSLAVLILTGCGSSSEQSADDTQNEVTAKSGGHSCLWEMGDTPEQLLTMEEASSLTGLAVEALDQDANPKYQNIKYEWDGGRKKELTIGGKKLPMDAKDFVAVNVKQLTEKKLNPRWNKDNNPLTPMEYFDKFHGGVSEDAKETIQEEIDKQKPEHAEGAKKVVGMIKFEGYQEYDRLGDKAYSQVNASGEKAAGLRQTELTFLHGNVVVTVVVDVSDNDEDDRVMAENIARAVAEKCG
ncbi:MAG: hypothetical protein ABJH05_06750 [Fulvivirga sp.]